MPVSSDGVAWRRITAGQPDIVSERVALRLRSPEGVVTWFVTLLHDSIELESEQGLNLDAMPGGFV